MSKKSSPKSHVNHIDVFLEDADMKYYSQRVRIEEKRVKQLLEYISDYITNPKNNKAIVETYNRGAVAGASSPKKEELDDFRSFLMSSVDQLSKHTPKGVPMVWKMFGNDILSKVAEVIQIRNNVLPDLKKKFEARRVQLSDNIRASRKIANNASSVALLRSTKLHPVWSVVASKVK